MKLWKASTASSTHSSPLTSRHTAEPLSSFFSADGTAGVGARLGNQFAQHSGLQLADGEDNEGLRPGVIVGHGQMYVDGVAIRRKGVKPRLGAAAEL